jgi:anti-anti-sigma regulatory factor
VLAVAAQSPGATALIVDGSPLVHLDSTGADTLAALAEELSALGVRLAIGGVLPQGHQMLDRSGALARLGPDAVFPSLRAAVESRQSVSTLPPSR